MSQANDQASAPSGREINPGFITEVVEALCLTEFALGEDWEDVQRSPEYKALYNSVHDVLKTLSPEKVEYEDQATTEDTSHEKELESKEMEHKDMAITEDIKHENELEVEKDNMHQSIYQRGSDLQALSNLGAHFEQSHQGSPDSTENARITEALRQLRNPAQFGFLPSRKPRQIRRCLVDRLGATRLSTIFKNHLGIRFPNAQEIDSVKEYAALRCNTREDGAKNMHITKCYELVKKFGVQMFKRGSGRLRCLGPRVLYLVLLFHSMNWIERKIVNALVQFREWKKAHFKAYLAMSPLIRAQNPDIDVKLMQLKHKRLQGLDHSAKTVL